MTSSQTIHIVGAGLAGLTLARSLKNKGIPSVIFEKNSSPARHNYGITLQPWACQALLRVLNVDEPTLYQRVAVDGVIGGRGYVHEKYPVSPGTQSLAPLRAHCGRLLNRGNGKSSNFSKLSPRLETLTLRTSEGLLRESLDIKWGYNLQGISRAEDVHVLKFRDKGEIQSKLVIDTSGVHSQIRKSLLPDLQLEVLPYVVFRGTRRLEGAVFRDRFKNHFKAANIIQTKKGGVLLQIQINDYVTDTDAVDISYIYSRPAEDEDRLHRPLREPNEAENISEIFFEEIAELEDLEAPFQETFAVEKMREERIMNWLMRDIMVPLPELLQLAAEGVVLIGDSVHAMPILAGEGANFAITDVIGLAGTIKERGIDGFRGFYRGKHGEWETAIDQIERRLADMHHLDVPVY